MYNKRPRFHAPSHQGQPPPHHHHQQLPNPYFPNPHFTQNPNFHNHPHFPFIQNQPYHPIPNSFNPNPPQPYKTQSQQPQVTLQAIDKAVENAHHALLSMGESIKSWDVSQAALRSLHVDSWNSLGFQMQQIPSLSRLMHLEAKVNAFIHCYVEVRKITSLYDLEIAICENEGIKQFDELQLGPLLRHPLVLHYFSVLSGTKEVHKITSKEIVVYLVEFMDGCKQKDIQVGTFLDFVASKQEVSSKEQLCIRIQNLRMHLTFIRDARKAEDSTLKNSVRISKDSSDKQKKKVEGKLSKKGPLYPQKRVLDRRFDALSERIKSFSPIQGLSDKHIRFVSSSSEDECDDKVINIEDSEKDDIALSNQSKISSQSRKISEGVSRCPYPSASEEMERLGLGIEMGGQSSRASSGFRHEEVKTLTTKKRKMEEQSMDSPSPCTLSRARACERARAKEETMKAYGPRDGTEVQSTENEQAHSCTMEEFITTWKETFRVHSLTEVLDRMLQLFKPNQKWKLRKLLAAYPWFQILEVAVTSINSGMWDSIYDTFQAVGERGQNGLVSASTEPELIDVEPSIKEHSITLEDMVKQFGTYFELNNAIPGEGKSPIEKQIMFLRKLYDCKKWLEKQFCVKKFLSLGHGEFFQFIEEHPFLLPNAMFGGLSEEINKKTSLEVSMVQHQLIKLLSQAAGSLWENNIITKQHIAVLFRKQFPLISFQVSGNGPFGDGPEFLKDKSSDNSNSVLFSVPLLRTYYGEHSLVQDGYPSLETQLAADFGETVGVLGSVSAMDAIKCLLKAPMLSDLLSWSHWDLVFAPSLGPLVEWLLSDAHSELLCLVTKDGKMIRIDRLATVDEFLETLIRGSSYETAVKLLSLFSIYGGETHVPLSLLKCHSRSGMEVILRNSLDNVSKENEMDTGIHGEDGIKKAVPVASRFILDCLGYFPSEFRSIAAGVLLSGLQSFTKDAFGAILHECRDTNERLMLHDIGLSLNILEWVTDYHAYTSATAKELLSSFQTSGMHPLSPTFCLGSMSKPDTLDSLLISDSEATVTVLSDKLNEVFSADHDVLNSISSERYVGGCLKLLPEEDSNMDASVFVENIRREEFGLDPSVTQEERSILKKQHARLGRALQCLSQELYSQDSHFLLELVQNADDNIYPENEEPTLVFIIHSSGIIVLNNERGFSADNIRALCDVGNSTKKGSRAGYIGQKGIGFKSVFRVTDSPEIHSNGFHVKFDITEGQIGFVLPTVVPPCNIGSFRRLVPSEVNQTDNCWNTCVLLPFKSNLREGSGMSSIISMFSDLHPSLLLFLHRLRCIKLKNMLNDSSIIMRKETVGNGMVKVSHGKENMSWFVATENLQCSVIRPDVQSTEIAVAFTLQELSNGEYRPHLDQQPVFAFLPLRTYGLKFILQGDFILPSSREEVDGDSAWNQWLLTEVPGLFVSAQRAFCALDCFQGSPGKAVAAYMSFVPLVGEVHGFFSHLPRMIISKLRVSNCLLLEGNNEEWVPPCRVLRGWDEQARVLLPDSLLRQHLGLGYLDKDIMLSDSLAKGLGVHEFGPRTLIDIISSICRTEDGIRSVGQDWLLSFLNALYTTLVHSSGQATRNSGMDADVYESLRKIPFIPLSNGRYSSVSEGTMWLPCDAFSCGFEGEHDAEAFPALYAKLRIVNTAFLSTAVLNPYTVEEKPVDNVIKILYRIGVQKLSAHELIKVHILLALSDDKVTDRDKDLMAEYLSLVMLHFQSGCPRCHVEREQIVSELKTKAFILTNHGYKRSIDVAIHFSRDFGNPVDMTKLVDAVNFKWHELDIIYLKHSTSKSLLFGLTKWREFFQELGVTDFVSIVQVEKNISDVSQTILKDMMSKGDVIIPGSVVNDWESPELVHLLTTLSSQNNREKSKYLLEILDRMWDDCFTNKTTGLCISTSVGVHFKSSLLNSIKDIQWVASSFDQSLHYPKHLFYDCEEVRSFLGNFASYAVPQVRSPKLVSDIGFKTRVSLDDAFEIMELWRSFKMPFTASVGEMSKFYAFIWDRVGIAKAKIAGEFSSKPSIFTPYPNFSGQEDVVSGKLMSANEVYWHDPTGSLDLTRNTLLQRGSLDVSCYPLNMILSPFYQDLHDFFVNDCKVGLNPPVRSYIGILLQLSKIALPSQAAKSVFRVVLKWANDLDSGLLEPDDVVYLKECFLKLENSVLPTAKDKWVSLHPTFGLVCWCDDEELKRQFEHSGNIDFVYFGELNLDEKEMLATKISGLMCILGVPSLSEVITRQAIFYGSDNCRDKAMLINWILPYAQRYIYKLHPGNYFQLKQSGFGSISQLQIVAVEKLFYQLTIKGCDSASKIQRKCSCLLQDNMLYVDRVSDSHSIFLELSRLFFNGNPELHLANFLHMITTMAESGSTEEQTEFFIVNSQKVPKFPEEEPLWVLSSFLSCQEESLNSLQKCSSATPDEQNLSKFKRKSSNNWPPANWKTAPDSSHARKNWFRKKLVDEPSSVEGDEVEKLNTVTYTEHQGVPSKIALDWIAQDAAAALHLPDLKNTKEQSLCSSEVLDKPVGSDTVENMEKFQITEREQLSFGTPGVYQAAVTGRVGELMAFRYLVEKVGGASVKWVNEMAETGLPYDIVIRENEETKEYIEVKATTSARKDWFEISMRELQFALEKGESFCIARVVLMGPNNAKVTLFKNPLRLCQQGILQLAVLIAKS